MGLYRDAEYIFLLVVTVGQVLAPAGIEDDGPLVAARDGEKSVLALCQTCSVYDQVLVRFDVGSVVGARHPDFIQRNEAAPDNPTPDSRGIVVDRNVAALKYFGGARFYTAPQAVGLRLLADDGDHFLLFLHFDRIIHGRGF